MSGTSLLRLSTASANGALEHRHLMMREAWWTREVAAPTGDQLDAWIVNALPQVVSTYFGTPTRALQRHHRAATRHQPWRTFAIRLLDTGGAVLVRGPAALAFCVLMQVLLGLLRILSMIPLPWLRVVLAPVINVLMGTTGQSYAVVTSELRRSAIVNNVSKHLDWLCQRCENVVVLAHSQGAEVSRLAIAGSKRPEVQHFFAFGSGIKMLNVLMRDPPARVYARCARLAFLVLGAAALALALGLPSREWALSAYWALAMIGIFFLQPPAFQPTFRRSVPMTEYYASRDPVPCGPLIENRKELASVKFKMIEVRNRASVLFDHTSYLENIEEFVAPVALSLAKLAGMNWFELLAGDRRRLGEAKRRRRGLVSRKQWIGRWSLLALIVATGACLLVSPLSVADTIRFATSAWTGPSLGDWLGVARGLPGFLLAALPLLVVAIAFWIERVLLHRRFVASARELTSRRPEQDVVRAAGVRIAVYAAAATGLAWWAYHVDFATALAAQLRRLAG